MIAITVALAVVSLLAVGCAFHYFYSAALQPETFLARNRKSNPTALAWVYFIAALGGTTVILFSGFDAILSWMPLSWGTSDIEGTFSTFRGTLAAALTSFCLPVFSFADNYAANALQVEDLKRQVAALKDARGDPVSGWSRQACRETVRA